MKTTLQLQRLAGALALFVAVSSQAQTETNGLILVPPDQVPPCGAFWYLSNGGTNGIYAPAPSPPDDPNEPIFWLGPGQYLVADEGAANASASAMTFSMSRFGAMDEPGGFGGGDDTPLFQFDTNGLFLEITNVVINGLSYLNLCHATDQVYAIWGNTNLQTQAVWQVQTEVWPTNSAVMPFTVPTLGRPNLFLRAEDWTGVTENGNTVPEWWFFEYFGNPNLADGDADSQGNHTLLYDYQHELDPNVISFIVTTLNQYVNSSLTPLQITIGAGIPSSMAVLVDSTNFAAASWTNYSPNPVASLGAIEGWHQIWVGLRGRLQTSQQTWVSARAKLVTTLPLLVITNPVSSVVSQPVIQLQGYCPEQLSSIVYSLSNTAGSISNQPVVVLDEAYDTNNYEFTTNYFQAFDVRLALGTNTITLYATDRAGNTSVTNLTLTLDYSSKTNPPILTISWPQNGANVGSATFTCRGMVSDPTAQVAAQFVDTNGVTNLVNGRVGRDGSFWLENLLLETGTNLFTLTAMDAVSNSCSTNLTVLQSAVGLTVDSASMTGGIYGGTAQGTVGDPTSSVWVNGVQATNNGDGTWTADGLNLTINTLVVQARAIPSTDNGGNGTGGGSASGGAGGTSEDQGNPSSASGTDAEMELPWPEAQIYMKSAHYNDWDNGYDWTGTIQLYFSDANWSTTGGGTDVGKSWDAAGNPTLDVLYTYPPGEWAAWRTFVWTDFLANTNMTFLDLLGDWPGGGEQGDMVYDYPNSTIFVNWHDHPQAEMLTGGEPGSTATALYIFSGGAQAMTVPADVYGYPEPILPPENVSVGALGNLDTNGMLVVALPDRTPVDVTPTVSGVRYYSVYLYDGRHDLFSQTVATIPTNLARSTLGVGEQVKLAFQPALPVNGYWSCSAGSLSLAYDTHTVFTAPSNAAQATVTFKYVSPEGRMVVLTTNFTVVEPDGVASTQIVATNLFNIGAAGAGMQLNVAIGPTNVSFYRVQIFEIGSNAVNATGYFTNNPPLPHGDLQKANEWHPIGDSNLVDLAAKFDTATYGGASVLPSPWTPGGQFTWPISALWKIPGGPTNSLPGWSEQDFSLDSSGTMTVQKFGHTVIRAMEIRG